MWLFKGKILSKGNISDYKHRVGFHKDSEELNLSVILPNILNILQFKLSLQIETVYQIMADQNIVTLLVFFLFPDEENKSVAYSYVYSFLKGQGN